MSERSRRRVPCGLGCNQEGFTPSGLIGHITGSIHVLRAEQLAGAISSLPPAHEERSSSTAPLAQSASAAAAQADAPAAEPAPAPAPPTASLTPVSDGLTAFTDLLGRVEAHLAQDRETIVRATAERVRTDLLQDLDRAADWRGIEGHASEVAAALRDWYARGKPAQRAKYRDPVVVKAR